MSAAINSTAYNKLKTGCRFVREMVIAVNKEGDGKIIKVQYSLQSRSNNNFEGTYDSSFSKYIQYHRQRQNKYHKIFSADIHNVNVQYIITSFNVRALYRKYRKLY